MAAILAVPDHEKILIDLISETGSPYRGQAAATAAFLRIEAAIPVILSVLDAPIPESPWVRPPTPEEWYSARSAEAGRHLAAVATWRVAVVGLALFDRPELIDRLTPILFDPPPAGFTKLSHPSGGDLMELDRAREAIYRMLVRSGRPSDLAALTRFEKQLLPPKTSGADEMVHGTEGEVTGAVRAYFSSISPRRQLTSRALGGGVVDQVAIRGDQARARIDMTSGCAVEIYRVSLRRQDSTWRVVDYWSPRMRD